jgi:hypothetical protein
MTERSDGANSDRGVGVFAPREYGPREVIGPLRGRECERPSQYSIQVGVDRHLELADEDPSGLSFRYLNHSCDPNAYIEIHERVVRAVGPIAAGEEVTIDYLATEWQLSRPFDCRCASAGCRGRIGGFAKCSAQVRAELSDRAAAHVRELAYLQSSVTNR